MYLFFLFNHFGWKSFPDASPTFLLTEQCPLNTVPPFGMTQWLQDGMVLGCRRHPEAVQLW